MKRTNLCTTPKTAILLATMTAFALNAPYAAAQMAHKSGDKPAAMSSNMDGQMGQMQERMKTMQGQMDAIHKATDPKARQALMQIHMKSMQEGMQTMHGMGGKMMMGGGTMGGGTVGGGTMGGGMKGGTQGGTTRGDMSAPGHDGKPHGHDADDDGADDAARSDDATRADEVGTRTRAPRAWGCMFRPRNK